MEPADNRPPTFGEILARALAAAPLSDREAETIVAAAGDLAKARSQSDHDWTAWRERAGLSAAAAKQVMEIHRLALTVADLEALGGVAKALRWAAEIQPPEEGEVLRIALPLSPDTEVTCYVWPSAGGFHVGLLDMTTDNPHGRVSPQACVDEHDLWATVWDFLRHTLVPLKFTVLDEDTSSIVELLDRRRLALPIRNPAHRH